VTAPTSQLLVIAKEPLPGRAKTRLSPPCTPAQAARIAGAALADTADVLRATPCRRRVAAVTGRLAPYGFDVLQQRGNGLGQRLANALADAGAGPSFLVGMDTPQLTAGLVSRCLAALDGADAVLGLAEDGGFWGIGVQHPSLAAVLVDVPMSTADTGQLTEDALIARGLSVRRLPTLVDVDTWETAVAVAGLAPDGRFAAAVADVASRLSAPVGVA